MGFRPGYEAGQPAGGNGEQPAGSSPLGWERSDLPVVGSLFSGIGGLDLGLARAGFRHAFFCESDEYRRRVLARHWPGVPIYEDVRDVCRGSDGQRVQHGASINDARRRLSCDEPASVPIDVVCGGFPCQDLSVAGRRAGLDGARSGLFFEFARVADALLADGGWLLVENVPGLLSSNGGRDFAVLLSTLGELGFYDLAWRVLDSRYFGVPQRRRRVFILGRRARGRRASEVLLEPESGGGDFEAGREARQGAPARVEDGIAGPLGMGQGGGMRTTDLDGQGAFVPLSFDSAFGRNSNVFDGETPPLKIGSGVGAPAGPAILGAPTDADGMRALAKPSRHLDDPDGAEPRAFQQNSRSEVRFLGERGEGDHVGAVAAEPGAQQQNYLLGAGGTGESDWPNPRPDGPRYAACGDAVTSNVAEWIGRRLIEHG